MGLPDAAAGPPDVALVAACEALSMSRSPFDIDGEEREPLVATASQDKVACRFGSTRAAGKGAGVAGEEPSRPSLVLQRAKRLAENTWPGGASSRWLLLGIVLIFLAVVVGLSPWWYPCLVWRPQNTSFVSTGAGVDPATHAVYNQTAFEHAPVPKIIHQTWVDENIPEKWRAARESCMQRHPDYQYILWTDAAAFQLVDELAAEFPALPGTFRSYRHGIQRADVVRYALLYKMGGIYIDLDIECRVPLDFLRQYPFVMPATRPVGFSQDFLVAAPGHPFLKRMLTALPHWNLNLLTKYPTVMFSTGPMFVTLQATFYRLRRTLWVLPDEMYGKYAKSPRQLFTHLFGSSWHGDDARSILWLLKHPFTIIGAVAVGCGIGAYRYWQLRRAARALAAQTDPDLLKIC